MGRLLGRADVVAVLASMSTPHVMGRGPGRPAKTRWPQQYTTYHGPRPGPAHENTWATSWAGRRGPYRAHISWAAARPSPAVFHRMGRGSRPIKFLSHGPRPSLTHQIFITWAAARPGPSHFHFFTARPINFSKFSARPSPAHHNFTFLGPARPGQSKFQISRPGPARPITTFLSFRPDPARTIGP